MKRCNGYKELTNYSKSKKVILLKNRNKIVTMQRTFAHNHYG